MILVEVRESLHVLNRFRQKCKGKKTHQATSNSVSGSSNHTHATRNGRRESQRGQERVRRLSQTNNGCLSPSLMELYDVETTESWPEVRLIRTGAGNLPTMWPSKLS